MVTPSLRKRRNAGSKRAEGPSPTKTEICGSTMSRLGVLAVKILLVIVILLWLPPLVIARKRRSQGRNSIKRTNRLHIYERRVDCETTCLESARQSMIPADECMNCIVQCMSPPCFGKIYNLTNGLEPGEVDVLRYELFEKCVEDEIREEKKRTVAEKNTS